MGKPSPEQPDQRSRFEALLSDDVYQAGWRFAYRLSSAREDAEDLLQESLAHAYARLHQLREPERFRAWLFSIIRSKHLRKLESSKRLRTTDLTEDAGGADSFVPTGLGGVVADGGLDAALSSLAPGFREVLLLHYLDDLSLAEVGQVLNIGQRAAKQRLYRARMALRGRLAAGFALGDFSALL